MRTSVCTRCTREVPGWDGVHQSDGKGGDFGFVCGRCWAQILSEKENTDIQHLEVAPVVLQDASGRSHKFHFRYNPIPRGLSAFELKNNSPGGYQFCLMADDGESSVSLAARLLTNMRRGLAQQHLKPCKTTDGALSTKDMEVRGRIEWDEEQDGQVPLVIVDGESISWNQFGRMLTQFEGWNFRLVVLDASDEDYGHHAPSDVGRATE